MRVGVRRGARRGADNSNGYLTRNGVRLFYNSRYGYVVILFKYLNLIGFYFLAWMLLNRGFHFSRGYSC